MGLIPLIKLINRCDFVLQSLNLEQLSIPTLVITILLLASGCQTLPTPPNQSSQTELQSQINWHQMNTSKPSKSELDHIRSDLRQKLPEIISALASGNVDERRRAAFILEALGPVAATAGPALHKAYQGESDERNKAFMIRALTEIGDRSPETLQFLKTAFNTAESAIIRTYLAGAIINLDGLKNEKNLAEIQSLLDSLNIPQMMAIKPFGDHSKAEYWERCWAATYMIGKLKHDGNVFIPVLELASDYDDIPEWVMKEIWFTQQKLSSGRYP